MCHLVPTRNWDTAQVAQMAKDSDGDDRSGTSLAVRHGGGLKPTGEPAWPPGIAISEEPVRRVHTRSRRRNTSMLYSTLPLGMRVSESQLETRFLKVAQLETRATAVRAQPVRLKVLEDGRVRQRIPDAANLIDGHAELHEIKQDAECWKPEVRCELLAIRDTVERYSGWHYRVTVESALLAEPLRSNTDMLWRELVPHDEIDFDLRMRTLSILDEKPITAAEVIEKTCESQCRPNACGSWNNLLAMIACRMVDYDTDELLTPDSMVWSPNAGPPRKRILPFGSVEDAIRLPVVNVNPAVFCGVQLRGVSK